MDIRNHLEEIWDQVPPDYYQKGIQQNLLQRIWHAGKLKAVTGFVAKYSGKAPKILDVGCASGWFLSEVSNRFPKTSCTGVDVYDKAIKYGSERYKKIKLIRADAHKLPFKNNTFDIAISCEVLEHVVDPSIVLNEMKRVIKKNGIIIIEIDSGNVLFRIVWYWWTNVRRGVWRDSHIHLFNVKKLERLFNVNNLEIKHKKTFNLSMAVIYVLILKS